MGLSRKLFFNKSKKKKEKEKKDTLPLFFGKTMQAHASDFQDSKV